MPNSNAANASVISDKKYTSSIADIEDEKLKEALNISDNESLENNIVLEEGIKIPVSNLNIEQFKQFK